MPRVISKTERAGEYRLICEEELEHYTARYECLRCGYSDEAQSNDGYLAATLAVYGLKAHRSVCGKAADGRAAQ